MATRSIYSPFDVEQWYDRGTRSWITRIVNALGHQVGDAAYDGNRTSAAVSKRDAETRAAGLRGSCTMDGDHTAGTCDTCRPIDNINYASPESRPCNN